MKSNATSNGVRRALFAGGLAATAAAAVLSPDWSSVLKAQGYYGSVDLSIEAIAPPRVQPGQYVTVRVVVHNQGPDTAHGVRTIATARQLNYVGGSGCTGSTYPRCELAAGLDVGSASYFLQMHVPSDARNHVQFSASVTSDDTEANPGDEITVMKIPIYVPVDLRSEIACERVDLTARGMVRCSIRFSNAGYASARLPTLRASVDSALSPRWHCESALPELCSTAGIAGNSYEAAPAWLPEGRSVTFFVEMLPNGAHPIVPIDAEARLHPAMSETDLVPENNQLHLDFEPPLFADDFETAD